MFQLIYKMKRRSDGFYNKVRNFLEKASKKKFATVPAKATIREEYVKCKKFHCMMCAHGPYYYAYWKENWKLKKKYIVTKYDKTWRKESKTGSSASYR